MTTISMSAWGGTSIGLTTTYVPGLCRIAAHAKTCRVASSDEDQPVLRGGRASCGVDSQDLPPVLQGDGMLDSRGSLGSSLLSCGVDGRRGHSRNRRGHGSSGLVEKTLDFVKNGDLLLSDSDRREG